MSVFGPHSTRGAALLLLKRLGASADVVCQLGKWQSVEAFAKHYLRLDAHEDVVARLEGMVQSLTEDRCRAGQVA